MSPIEAWAAITSGTVSVMTMLLMVGSGLLVAHAVGWEAPWDGTAKPAFCA